MLVTEAPIDTQPARPAARARPGDRRRAVPRAGRRVRRSGPRLPARPGGRRLALPDPPRPGALRRAVRARGADSQAVGRRPRDPGDRRLQAAHLAGAGGVHPRRQRRRRDAHAAAAGLHRRDRPRPRPRPGGACTAPPRRSSRSSGLDSLADLPRAGRVRPRGRRRRAARARPPARCAVVHRAPRCARGQQRRARPRDQGAQRGRRAGRPRRPSWGSTSTVRRWPGTSRSTSIPSWG